VVSSFILRPETTQPAPGVRTDGGSWWTLSRLQVRGGSGRGPPGPRVTVCRLTPRVRYVGALAGTQAYISYVKATFQPQMTPPAEQILARYYQLQRQADTRNAARTTIRLLESLIRLSEAHARLMFRNEVIVMDAVVAVTLVESSMQTAALLGPSSALHSAFPHNPQEEYAIQGTSGDVLAGGCAPMLCCSSGSE